MLAERVTHPVRDLMWDAIVEKETEEQYPDPRSGRWEKGTLLRNEGPKILEEIGTVIRQRLWQTASFEAGAAPSSG